LNNTNIVYYKSTIIQSTIDNQQYNKLSFFNKLRFFVFLYRRKRLSFKELDRIVRKEKPDIIHTNVGTIHEGFWVAKKNHIPHMFHIREYQDKDFNWRIIPSKLLYCWILKRSFVITITDALGKHFRIEKYSKRRTIYNGIYEKEKTALMILKEKFFLCASRISKEKGLSDVVRAFSLFHQTYPNYSLVIAGKGSPHYIEELMCIAKEGKCEESIVFLGHIDNPFEYMKKAKALIVGSYNEGFGRMTAEAAFAGCLVIGRNSGGTKEILDKTGGYSFIDYDGIVKAMKDIEQLSDEEYLEKATQAQKVAQQLYSTEQNIDAIYSFYLEIMKEEK
jgi:glycosyltransferase involved in cell wall biosynthesis